MKISVVEPLGIKKEVLEDKLRKALGPDVTLVLWGDRKESEADLAERSKDADVVVVSNIKYGRTVIEQCQNLKMICVAFTGFDHIDLACCKERDIVVCNCAGYSTVAVADLVFALVLSLARNVLACDKSTREGKTKDGLVGFELEGKKFGIIGLGAICTRVAKIALAFGCEVYAYSRTKKEIPGVIFTDFQTVLRESDIVSLHVPQNASTIGMIGKDEFALMKKSAFLINVARGPIVDTQALVEALNEGVIAGAGIDVFDKEPPLSLDYSLLGTKNTILTPHVAFASSQAFGKRADIVAENIKSWRAGSPYNVVSL
jgi:D-3-phosphoglycerate dehydrogenase